MKFFSQKWNSVIQQKSEKQNAAFNIIHKDDYEDIFSILQIQNSCGQCIATSKQFSAKNSDSGFFPTLKLQFVIFIHRCSERKCLPQHLQPKTDRSPSEPEKYKIPSRYSNKRSFQSPTSINSITSYVLESVDQCNEKRFCFIENIPRGTKRNARYDSSRERIELPCRCHD